MQNRALDGVTVAVPETRQQDLFGKMLQARGAKVLPVPLVSIHDNPDQPQVLAWMKAFISNPPEILVLLTGEGLRRLLALAEREGLRATFEQALSGVCKLCRGPKPERVLVEIGQQAGLMAENPTTAGVINTLSVQQLQGRQVAVQLYGEEPNLPLQDFLRESGAVFSVVAPYIYASKEDEDKVAVLIRRLADGLVDVLAFTSQSQFKRMQAVARSNDLSDQLHQGMQRTLLAAVGPVVRDQLEAAGYPVAIMPQRVYFMKPLVAAIERYLQAQQEQNQK